MLYLVQRQTLEAIADKIREKIGRSVNMTPAQMRDAIMAELEKVSGDKLAIGDGEYDVRNVATLTVQNNLNPESILYYEYDDAATALTISVNPNPSGDYEAIDIDKLLGDLYIGRSVRSYTTPIMPGMDWLMSWLTAKEITTFAEYKAQASPAWYFHQRALLCKQYYNNHSYNQQMLDTGEYNGISGLISDENGNTIGDVTAFYDSTTHKVRINYALYLQHGVETVQLNSARISIPELVVATDPLPFGDYELCVEDTQFSGSEWTGTWPVKVAFRFAGALTARDDIVLETSMEEGHTSADEDIALDPALATAGKIYVVVNPAFSGLNVIVPNGASITIEFQVRVGLWFVRKVDDELTATLADVLRYADTLSPRYKLKCLGANFPTLLIDPAAHTAKGYPVDAVDHLINNTDVQSLADSVVISTRCAAFTNEARDGTEYDVHSLKATYRPNGYCYGVLSEGQDGETSGVTYRSYQYSVCRKSDADG